MSGVVFAVIWVVFAVLAVALTRRCVRRDPRWLGNAFLVPASVLCVLGAMWAVPGGEVLPMTVVLLAFVSPLLIVALIGFLIWNGIFVMQKEGPRLAHGLSLLLGLGLLAVGIASVASVLSRHDWLFDVMLFVGLFTAWIGALLLGYIGYSVLYGLLVRGRRPDYVVVLGAGLDGDQVTPLLARRVERGLAVYRRWAAAGRAPMLVLSGGKGSDEQVAEGDAMARYALAHGARPEDVRVEDRSATTEQNLRYSSELVAADPRLGPASRGLVVTSNYHALRAAVLARSLGLPLDAIGAPVAWWYWPSAMLREFVAVVVLHWRIVIGLGLLFSLPLPLALAYGQYA